MYYIMYSVLCIIHYMYIVHIVRHVDLYIFPFFTYKCATKNGTTANQKAHEPPLEALLSIKVSSEYDFFM
jgi:hypothetical protein